MAAWMQAQACLPAAAVPVPVPGVPLASGAPAGPIVTVLAAMTLAAMTAQSP
jgi:hypothetical protein